MQMIYFELALPHKWSVVLSYITASPQRFRDSLLQNMNVTKELFQFVLRELPGLLNMASWRYQQMTPHEARITKDDAGVFTLLKCTRFECINTAERTIIHITNYKTTPFYNSILSSLRGNRTRNNRGDGQNKKFQRIFSGTF